MKKINFTNVLFLIGIGFLISCNNPSLEDYSINEKENQIEKNYFTKDVKNGFLNFLEDPDSKTQMHRSVISSTSNQELSEEEMFAGLWDSLTEEEKEKVLENSDEVKISFDASISFDADSSIGRSVLSGDNTDLENMSILYGFTHQLKDWFNEQYVNSNILPLELELSTDFEVPVAQVLEYCIQNEKWDVAEEVLNSIQTEVTLKDLKELAKKVNKINDTSIVSTARTSACMGYLQNPIRKNVGETLKDGTVLLTLSKKKAFVVAGDWVHAGIFSKEAFKTNGSNDAAHCVYSAQPNDLYDAEDLDEDFPVNMRPDRKGSSCLDTIYLYTRQKKFATILPKNYEDGNGTNAVNTAKNIFYKPKPAPAYNIPEAEFFYIGNTSHDETNSNTYCSKVVYTAWKKNGVNLDGNTFAGNLVSPDDIYGSTANRYFTITVSIFGWSKTWTWKTYSATSDLITLERQ